MRGIFNPLLLLAVSLTFLLLSCIDGREELWVNADGSGRAEVTYTIPETVTKLHGGADGVRKRIAEALGNAKGIFNTKHEVSAKDGRVTIHVGASFPTPSELRKARKEQKGDTLPSSISDLGGDVVVKRDGLTLDISRTIAWGKGIPGISFMPDSKFKGHNLVYVVHLPQPALDSNATRIENSGKTLAWDFPLEKAIREPVVTRLSAKIPLPAWIPWTIGAVILSTFGGLYLLVRRFRRAEPRPVT